MIDALKIAKQVQRDESNTNTHNSKSSKQKQQNRRQYNQKRCTFKSAGSIDEPQNTGNGDTSPVVVDIRCKKEEIMGSTDNQKKENTVYRVRRIATQAESIAKIRQNSQSTSQERSTSDQDVVQYLNSKNNQTNGVGANQRTKSQSSSNLKILRKVTLPMPKPKTV